MVLFLSLPIKCENLMKIYQNGLILFYLLIKITPCSLNRHIDFDEFMLFH